MHKGTGPNSHASHLPAASKLQATFDVAKSNPEPYMEWNSRKRSSSNSDDTLYILCSIQQRRLLGDFPGFTALEVNPYENVSLLCSGLV